MRVVFLGNHTVGVRVLEALSESDEIAGVVAHLPDPEDGVRYESVYDFAVSKKWTVIRSKGKAPETEQFVKEAKPDLLWISDYRYLLPASIISLAPFGAVNLHPSLLPKYRGRASINWAILKGERELGLTAHFVDEGMDTGDIIEQARYELTESQDVGDALNILYPIYKEITTIVMGAFRSGNVPRRLQDHSQATAFPGRKPKDGLIDWNQSAEQVFNLIRAVAKPYPGAFTFYHGKQLLVWSATLQSFETSSAVPGEIIGAESNGFFVQTGSGTILVTNSEYATSDQPLDMKTGSILESA